MRGLGGVNRARSEKISKSSYMKYRTYRYHAIYRMIAVSIIDIMRYIACYRNRDMSKNIADIDIDVLSMSHDRNMKYSKNIPDTKIDVRKISHHIPKILDTRYDT